MSAGTGDAPADGRGGEQISGGLRPPGELIARLAIFEGMRPGEILALRWKSFADERHPRGAACLQAGLRHAEERQDPRRSRFRTARSSCSRSGPILPRTRRRKGSSSRARRSPRRCPLDNLWRRTCNRSWRRSAWAGRRSRCLRKTNASLSKKCGVDPKVAADQRGHGIGVSMDVYTSSDLEQKRAAVNKLEAAVLRKPQP